MALELGAYSILELTHLRIRDNGSSVAKEKKWLDTVASKVVLLKR
jgi:hypothetical protein